LAGDSPRVPIPRIPTAVFLFLAALLPAPVLAQGTGAVSGEAVMVAAEATDDVGVAGVQFLVNDEPIGAEDASYPYSVLWDTTSVPNGVYRVRARARDNAGNQSLSEPVDVLVDNPPPPDTTPPEVALTAPREGEILDGVTILAADSTDVTGVEAVAFYMGETHRGEATPAPGEIYW
jgi:hypothetical protein